VNETTTPDRRELRTLLLSASLGGGHQKAGEALSEALGDAVPGYNAVHIDYLEYLTPLQRGATAGVYMWWLKYSPASYRFFYNWTNRENEWKIITAGFGTAGLSRLARDLRRTRPHLVISSYTAPVTLADTARKRLKMNFLNVELVTDYSAHHHWARPEADVFLVATDAVKADLVHWGMNPEKIAVTGIPIMPRVANLVGAEKAPLRERFGLDPEDPVVLVSAGAQGTYRGVDEVVAACAAAGGRVQVLLLAGSGWVGTEQVGGATVHRLGYTRFFPELLAASDLVVGKAGGLTVAEALTLGVPMLVYEPIPGQEEGNARYLESMGAALWAHSPWELRRDLLTLLGDSARRDAMSRAARAISRPDAAHVAARELVRRVEALQ